MKAPLRTGFADADAANSLHLPGSLRLRQRRQLNQKLCNRASHVPGRRGSPDSVRRGRHRYDTLVEWQYVQLLVIDLRLLSMNRGNNTSCQLSLPAVLPIKPSLYVLRLQQWPGLIVPFHESDAAESPVARVAAHSSGHARLRGVWAQVAAGKNRCQRTTRPAGGLRGVWRRDEV